MRLLYKTSLYFFISSLVLFSVCGVLFYWIVLYEINHEIDVNLQRQKVKILEHVKNDKSLPDFDILYDVKIGIEMVENYRNDEEIKDTLIYNDLEHQNLTYRKLSFYCNVNQKVYRIDLMKSFFEMEDLIKGILTFLVLLLLFMLLAIFSVNVFVSRITFKPFNIIIQQLEKIDLTKDDMVEFANATTKEFKILRKAVIEMVGKAKHDYHKQKEFIENASHELQTPVAIIKSKCEMLLQDEEISENQAKLIKAVFDSASRLAKLNGALLMITRIENNQFPENEVLSILNVVNKHIENFEDLMKIKSIKVEKSFSEDIEIRFNPILLDIVFANLISNAIKYTPTDGIIIFEVKPAFVIVKNSGAEPIKNSERLFKRFFKERDNLDSMGIGLTIVKKVLDHYNFKIDYKFENGFHVFAIAL